MDGSKRGLAEMGRVLKPGGILALTTECIVNGMPHTSLPNLELFSPATLDELLHSSALLKPVEAVDYLISAATIATSIPLPKAVKDINRGIVAYPHIVLEIDDRQFTSAAAFLVRE